MYNLYFKDYKLFYLKFLNISFSTYRIVKIQILESFIQLIIV